jgi:hypothetical protein
MRLEPPFLVVREGRSFWVETRAPEECSATLQAFRKGCFREAWCYDSTGGRWPILAATLKRRPSFIDWMLPWTHVAVELQLGSRVEADLAAVVSRLANVLQSNNEFCESLPTAPAELVVQFRSARGPMDVIEIVRRYA